MARRELAAKVKAISGVGEVDDGERAIAHGANHNAGANLGRGLSTAAFRPVPLAAAPLLASTRGAMHDRHSPATAVEISRSELRAGRRRDSPCPPKPATRAGRVASSSGSRRKLCTRDPWSDRGRDQVGGARASVAINSSLRQPDRTRLRRVARRQDALQRTLLPIAARRLSPSSRMTLIGLQATRIVLPTYGPQDLMAVQQ